MASSSTKVGKPVRYKCLSTITLGGNEIRFVGVNERNNGVHFPHSVNNCAGRLLFVAVDVMCSSKLSKKNYIRVITRFSKLGLAVKMRLTGFKIDGINNSSVIWFFSIQGLFQVAFDLGNMAFQKDCLSQLQDVWLRRYEDPLLPEESVLRFNKRLTILPEDCELSQVNNPERLERETEIRQHIGRSCTNKNIIIFSDSNEYLREETVYSENGLSVHSQEGTSLSETENSMNCDDTEEKHSYEYLGTEEFRMKLTEFIRSTFSEEVSNFVEQKIVIVLQYLSYFASSLKQTESFESFGSTLFKIMEEFLVLAGLEYDSPGYRNTFGISRENFIFLYLISDWLGNQFHDLEAAIKQNVESFKKENITCIDSLPSPETIIDTLFPSFMKTFVSNWLGFCSENIAAQNPSELNVLSDHSYIKQTNKNESGNVNYQLIQLILEFGSNCLISGIGHVVFSRLRIQNRTDA